MRKKIITAFLAFFAIGALSGCEKTIDISGHTVTWKNDDGSILLVQHDIANGASAMYPLSTPPQKNSADSDSYYFVGWSPRVSSVWSDQTYTAVYELEGEVVYYKINYVLDGGTNSQFNSESYYFGEYLPLFDPSKDNCYFLGWFDEFGNQVTTIDTYRTGDIILYAQWKEYSSIPVHIYSTGLNDSNSFNFTTESSDGAFFDYYAPSITGYQFVNWKLNGYYFTDSEEVSLTIFSGSSYNLEAVYTPISNCYVYFYSNDPNINLYETYTCFSGSSIDYTAPYFSNFDFEGFYYNGELICNNRYLTNYSVYSDMEIEVRYKYLSNDFSYRYEKDISGYKILSYLGSSNTLYIPSSVGGYPVREIGDDAFYGNTYIQYVSIPISIKRIGSYAFANSSVIEVYFESTSLLEYLGDYAFYFCVNLTSIDLSNCAYLYALNYDTFYYCTNLSYCYLPSYLTTIGSYTFCYIGGNLNLTIPTSVTYIDVYGFYYNSSVTIVINDRYQTDSWNSQWNYYGGTVQYNFD